MRQERIVRSRRLRRRRAELRDRPAVPAGTATGQRDETDEVLRRIDAVLSDPHPVDGP